MAKNKSEFELWSRTEQKRETDKDDLVNLIPKINGNYITAKEYAWKYNLHPRTVQISVIIKREESESFNYLKFLFYKLIF